MTWGPLLLSATTVRTGVAEELVDVLGTFTHAKSREGSQISATALGRYPPTVAAKLFPTFCDVLRIMLANVGLACFRSGAEMSAVLSSYSYSDGSSWLLLLLLRSRDEDGGLTELEAPDTLLLRLALGAPSLKMCTVSVADDTQSRVEVELKDML